MKQKTISAILTLALLVPELVMAQGTGPVTTVRPQPPASTSTVAQTTESPQSVRPQPQSQRRSYQQRRSYERETRGRRRRGISKEEKIFLVAVAGSSMGIGALAGGPEGLAIGAIVGGWSAYAAHRLWGWIR